MAGMDEVGRLFNNNELIVAEVLQSAESMKAAVGHLEPFMEKKRERALQQHENAGPVSSLTDSGLKGTVILATVKGDVHDIGKNLVEIILANNGYRVINLGIKVAPETLIEAVRTHQPDLVGLSGLLVKSAQQMVVTAQDLTTAQVTCPLLVGGAALTPRFTANKIAPEYDGLVCYANDAMRGLDLANQIMDKDRYATLVLDLEKERERLAQQERTTKQEASQARRVQPATLSHDRPAPHPPDLRLHTLDDYDLDTIFTYLNPTMLYGKHLGLRGNLETLLTQGDEKAVELHQQVEAVIDEVIAKKLLRAQAVYQFFPAQAEGDSLRLYRANGKDIAATFLFPRQQHGEGLCLSDFAAPTSSGKQDYIALFAVTCGHGVRELAEQYRASGRYLQSHILQALAIEGAEAFAELLHQRLREMWGFADPPELTMRERFKARYRGVRVSFGYPACPRLEDQERLFQVLPVTASIGVELTEGYMMEPEASVSALVFHHPQAKYFNILDDELAAFERRLAERANALGVAAL